MAMFRLLIRSITVALAALWSLAVVAAPVAVPGTKVTLEPPPGFELSKQFPGFMREDVTASIVVSELPAPVVEMQKAMARKEDLATKGMTLIGSEPVKHDGKDAVLVNVSQQASGIDFLKWILVTGEGNAATLVVATFRADTADELSAPMRTAVLSTSLGAAPKDQFEGLLFRITPSSKLKIATRMSNMLLLNESGTTTPAAAEAPLYVIGNSVSEAPIGDLPKFAQARAAKTAKVKDVRNFKGKALKLDGLDAYELVADATDAKSGAALRLYQLIAPGETGYFIAQGLVGSERAGEFVPEFQRITASFKQAR